MPSKAPSPVTPLPDPNLVDQDTIYMLTHDAPEQQLRAGDFVIVGPGQAPVVRRVLRPSDVYALRGHLSVCYADEHDPAPEWNAPSPSRHLRLVE